MARLRQRLCQFESFKRAKQAADTPQPTCISNTISANWFFSSCSASKAVCAADNRCKVSKNKAAARQARVHSAETRVCSGEAISNLKLSHARTGATLSATQALQLARCRGQPAASTWQSPTATRIMLSHNNAVPAQPAMSQVMYSRGGDGLGV